jgi:uncharacterized protein YdeI (YjbR/CyaY-like superfamily)
MHVDIDKFERVEITSKSELWRWLELNYARTDSVWLVTWKAKYRDRFVSRDEVLDALLAYGWIDGRRLKLCNNKTMQLVSPRKQTAWAESYKVRATRLIQEGRMMQPGFTLLEIGRASGLWDYMAEVDQLVEPDDLVSALSADGAYDWWTSAAPSYRRNILRWLKSAKGAETRTKRIRIIVDHCARGQKVPQY